MFKIVFTVLSVAGYPVATASYLPLPVFPDKAICDTHIASPEFQLHAYPVATHKR